MILWPFVIGAVAIASPVAASTVPGTIEATRSAGSFLPDGDRTAFVVAKIEQRDRELENCGFSASESDTNVRVANGSTRFMHRDRYDERRLGDRLWMHLTGYEYYTTKDKIRLEALINWDGHTSRVADLPPYWRVDYCRGTISGTENDNFVIRVSNEILGFRLLNDHHEPRSLPVWLREALASGDEVDVDAEMNDGVQRVRMRVRNKFNLTRELWLDPTRGYMLVRFERVYRTGKSFNRHWDDVLSATQVGGVWVPTRVRRRASTSASAEETETVCDISRFTIGGVKEADMEVAFPVRSLVVDQIQRISYRVEPGAKYALRPLANPPAGELYVPRGHNVVTDHVNDGSAAKLYRTERLVLANAAQPGSRRLRVWLVLLNGFGAAGALTLYVLRRRRRNQVHQGS